VNIELTDGTVTVARRNMFADGTIEDVKRWIRDEVTKLNRIEAITIPNGSIDTAPAITPPYEHTPADIFAQKVFKLKAAKRAIDLGVLPANNPSFLALQADVAANIKWEYAELF
jgi:hypothetical protein